ncbi:major capsid protein [Shewanella chilikensis]|uniref:major capsid protein n=1 Tax=Shewanella chilikensis TaxID=558541 RepID=UPI003A982AD6
MATIQIADIYDPLRFTTMAQERQVEKNAFIQSGVMVGNAELSTLCGQSGFTGDIDNIKPLTLDEPTYTNDNPNDSITFDKLGTQQMKYRKAARAKAWSAMDLARGIGLQDPMTGITNRIGDYWANDNQKRLIYSLQGILADNVANDGGDMVHNVATDAAGAITDAEKASALNFIKALELKGDMVNMLSAFAMHSSVYYGLYALNLIEFVRESEDASFATFQGKRVIVDDGLVVVQGTNRPTYTSILFGAGAVESGEGNMPNTMASELDRKPEAGNGGGETRLFSRRTDIIMPVGFSWIDTTVAGQTATYAELQDATNWDRIWDPKNIPIAFLQTNG